MGILRRGLSTYRWRIRLTLWTAAALAGVAVVGFAKLADLALAVFFAVQTRYPWAPFLTAPLAGMLTVWLTRRYFPGAQGSGIPQVIAASRLATHGPVDGLLSLRIAFGKIAAGALALTGGFSAGREGPSVQVAASILHYSHRLLPNSRVITQADMILAGGAAGIAAAFNTPLAGIVFAVEELGKRLESRTNAILVSAIILSGVVSLALVGNYNYFGHLSATGVGADIIGPVIFFGVVCGVLGGAFSRLLLWPQQQPGLRIWRFRGSHPVMFAGACGLAVALIGWLGGGLSFGSGYAITSSVVAGHAALPWHAPLTRFLATVISYFSGIPGGIFAPCLAVGAAVGATITQAFGLDVGTVPATALCMAAFLAAVTQSPITAAIIVMEMIDGHGLVISLMAVTLIANVVSSRLSPELYQRLAHAFMPAPRHPRPVAEAPAD